MTLGSFGPLGLSWLKTAAPAAIVVAAPRRAALPLDAATLACPHGPHGSWRAVDEEGLRKWATVWQTLLEALLEALPHFVDLSSLASRCLWKVLVTKTASTLQRHLRGFKVFIELVSGHSAEFVYDPGRLEPINFLSAVGESKRSVTSAVSALKFAGGIMGWAVLLRDLECQVVAAWNL